MAERSKIVWGIVGVLILGGLVWWGSQWPGSDNMGGEPLKVGAILSLTGDLSFVGTHIQQGMTMALEYNPEANVQIIFEDDESFDAASAVSALNKLVNVDNVTVVFNEAVNTVKALAPTIKAKQIPTLVVWDNTQELAALDDSIFGFGYSTEKTGERAAGFVMSDLKARSVTVVSAHDEWSEIISGAFAEEFREREGRIDAHHKVDVDEADLRTVIIQAKQAGSEAIFFPLFQSGMVGLAKQAKELGYTGFLITGDSLTGVELQDFASTFEGVYSIQPWLADSQSFSKQYEDTYGAGTDSAGLAYAGLGYDVTSLLLEVIDSLRQDNQPLTPENLREGISTVQFKGVTGETDFSTGNVSDRVESITVVKSGQLELIEY